MQARGTFTYDVSSEGRGAGPEADDITGRLHDHDSGKGDGT